MELKIVVISSTNGGVISQLLKINYFKERVVELVSDRQCGAIDVAINAGIKTTILKSSNGSEFSDKILEYLDVTQIDLFVSFYTKLFNEKFIQSAKNKVINLHPSILPACPGLDGFGDTLKSGSKFVGSTIHFVDKGIDTGLPIIQSAIPVDQNKSIEDIRHLIFIDQCRTLLQVVNWFESNRVTINNNKVKIIESEFDSGIYSPKLDFDIAKSFSVPNPDHSAEIISTTSDSSHILDLRNKTNHPVSFLYSEIYSTALLNGEIKDGRSQPGFSLDGKSPFVLAAKSALDFGLDKDGVIDIIQSTFQNYYKLVQPNSAAEWLGLNLNETNRLYFSPPWAAVFPWRARSLESYQYAYEKAALTENGVVGEELSISKGWLFCGPVSDKKSRIEALRIHYVLNEISKNGYQRWNTSEGDVKATALVNETGEWRWLITGGNHRASAASALGYSKIPIRVNLVINRQHVKFWKHVIAGLYSEENALRVFDNYFNGIPPPVTDDWIKIN